MRRMAPSFLKLARKKRVCCSNGLRAQQRLAARRREVRRSLARSKPGCARSTKLSRHRDVALAIDYMLKRWTSFTSLLEDGHNCLTNNAAERARRGLALGRKARPFAGSDRGGERAALLYGLLVTASSRTSIPRLARRCAGPHCRASVSVVLRPRPCSRPWPENDAYQIALSRSCCSSRGSRWAYRVNVAQTTSRNRL
jgi:hypothetical protein